ncbi:hypothetical protein BSKO_00896 [Bryopsis sp. KO-2023]|nr:hypothetical protein BSKO_00896 [Bryopsis sp. KO-2023]
MVSLFAKSAHLNGKMKEIADKEKRVRNPFEWGKCFTACLSGSASPRALDSPLSSTRSWTILTQDNFSQGEAPPRDSWQPSSPRSSLSEDVFFIESSFGSSVADVASEFDDLTRTNQNPFESSSGPNQRSQAPENKPPEQGNRPRCPGVPPRPSLIPRAPQLPRHAVRASGSAGPQDVTELLVKQPSPDSLRSESPSLLDSDSDSDSVEARSEFEKDALMDSQLCSFLDIDYTRFIELNCQKLAGSDCEPQNQQPEPCLTSESGCWASPMSLNAGFEQPVFFPPIEAHKPSGDEDEVNVSLHWR